MELSSEIPVPVKRRRRYSSQFKAQVLEETLQPGISVAAVARRHNLNANLVHKWREAAQRGHSTVPQMPAFIPLPAPPSSELRQPEVRIEVPTSQGSVTLFWPSDQSRSLAELLKQLS